MTNSLTYNVQNLYVGPSSDSQAVLLPNTHLVQRLYRIQSFDYNINLNRRSVYEFGSKSSILESLPNHPDVSFSFDYYQFGVSNESKLGINANYNLSGLSPIYGQSGCCLFSGFLDSSRSKDKRNFYLTISKSGKDAHSTYLPMFASGLSGYSLNEFVDPYSSGYEVISFVNSYLTSLSYQGSIGEFPATKLNYVADDMVYFMSGSGFHAPKLSSNFKSGLFSDYKVAFPRHYQSKTPAALTPGDIRFFLTGHGYLGSMPDIGMNFQDAKIQSYSIDLSIPREKLQFLSQKHPVDRPPNYPIQVNFSVDGLVGDLIEGTAQLTSSIYGPTWLKCTSDNLYYAFQLFHDGSEYIFDIDQSSSTPAFASNDYWVITCADDSQNYKVYLKEDNGDIVFEIEQTPTLEPGSPYETVIATDSTFHKIYLVLESGYVIIQIDQSSSTGPVGETSGFGAHGSLNRLKFIDCDYDAQIKINNSLPEKFEGQRTAMAFDLKKLKLQSIDFDSSIESRKSFRMEFKTEIDPDHFSKGLFVSGILNNYIVSGSLINNLGQPYGEGIEQAGGKVVDSIYISYNITSGNNSELLVAEDGTPIRTEDILYTPDVF